MREFAKDFVLTLLKIRNNVFLAIFVIRTPAVFADTILQSPIGNGNLDLTNKFAYTSMQLFTILNVQKTLNSRKSFRCLNP